MPVYYDPGARENRNAGLNADILRRERRIKYSRILAGAIIGLNVGVFITWNSLQGIMQRVMYRHFSFSEVALFDGRWWTLFTSGFSHKDPYHIISNMYTFWSCSAEFGKLFGPGYTLGIYLLGAAGSCIAHLAFSSRMHQTYLLGASGAVMALLTALAVVNPSLKLKEAFLPPVGIRYHVAARIALEIAQAALFPNSQISHLGHIGGAVVGFLSGLVIKDLRNYRM